MNLLICKKIICKIFFPVPSQSLLRYLRVLGNMSRSTSWVIVFIRQEGLFTALNHKDSSTSIVRLIKYFKPNLGNDLALAIHFTYDYSHSHEDLCDDW